VRPAEKPHGPRPGGPVQWGKGHAAQRRGTRSGRAHGAVTVCSPCAWRCGGALVGGLVAAGQRQGVANEHQGSSGETPCMVVGN
jgi:hypothetical protein